MSISNSPSRFSRAFKRLSLKTAQDSQASLPIVVEDAQGDDIQVVQDETESRRFSISFFRPPTRLSTYSNTVNGRTTKVVKEAHLNFDSKVDIKLDCTNEDGVYRPGDTLQGEVMLGPADMTGKALRSVKVRIEGRAKTPRYEVQMNNLDDELQRMVKTRQWLFYSDQAKIFPPKKSDLVPAMQVPALDVSGSHVLPFAFDLPKQDSSAALSGAFVAHSTPNWHKPAKLPPTCKITDDESGEQADSPIGLQRSSSIRKFFQSSTKPNVCEISYFVIVEVQWQRNVLHSNKCIAKMEVVVHPSPPTTASVTANLEDLLRRRRRRLASHNNGSSSRFTLSQPRHAINDVLATTETTSGQTNWRNEGPSFLSQRLSRNMSTVPPDADSTNAASNREVAVIDSDRGPRGWYIERYIHNLASGQAMQIEFSYPAVPCLFMDKEMPFEVKVTYPSQVGGGIMLVASDMNLDLLRHINSYSLGGRLCLESKHRLTKEDNHSMIYLSGMESNDTSAAPTDEYSDHGNPMRESRKSFSGRFKIQSGLERARPALEASKALTLNATNQEKVHVAAPADQIILPSFKFRGLSVEYSVGICLTLQQVRLGDDNSIGPLPPFVAHAETSCIQLQSRCSSWSPPGFRESQAGDSTANSRATSPEQRRISSESTSLDVDTVLATPEQQDSDDGATVRDRPFASNRPLITQSTSDPFQGHADLHASDVDPSALHGSQSDTSPSLNIDIKERIAQNHHDSSSAAEQIEEQPSEAFEYIYEHPFSTEARERSGSCFSDYGAGLPPAYCSPNLNDSRRL